MTGMILMSPLAEGFLETELGRELLAEAEADLETYRRHREKYPKRSMPLPPIEWIVWTKLKERMETQHADNSMAP